MPANAKKPSWTNVKSILATQDKTALLMLIKDLYALNKHNKTFIETRYFKSADSIEPYKKRIEDALYPDEMNNEAVSFAKARKASVNTKKLLKTLSAHWS